MSKRRPPRRHNWNRSHTDGFGPIRQVGIAPSVGFPLMIVGVLMLAVATSSGGTLEWVSAIVLLVGGAILASSGRVT